LAINPKLQTRHCARLVIRIGKHPSLRRCSNVPAINARAHAPESATAILGPRSICARLYVVHPHQAFGAETAFAETARFIKVSALIR
jgi:hypothetical protein